MKRFPVAIFCLLAVLSFVLVRSHLAKGADAPGHLPLTEADSKDIRYVGRFDFTDPKKPKFWAPGAYIQARFRGTSCEIAVNDEVRYGTTHNYIEVAVDSRPPFRVQTTGKTNVLPVTGLPPGAHTITLCKDTESEMGYLEFVGLRCEALLPPPPQPRRKMEFIGDSITCGASSDLSLVPCDKRKWYDQHNAYLSYGPTTARALHAQWHLSSVSGIGLMHSCCDMKATMPDVFGSLNLRDKALPWDFGRYQPEVVTICLGQNDGEQDPTAFRDNYTKFIQQVRTAYPKAQIVCLSSPMGDARLTAYLKDNLTLIVDQMHQSGDKNVHAFFFSRSYNSGCGGHPDVTQHQQIAGELTAYLQTTLH